MIQKWWVVVAALIFGGACAGASSPSESATVSFDIAGPFWSVAPDNAHDSRDEIVENIADLVIVNGQFQSFSGSLVSHFPATPIPNADRLGCGTDTVFELVGNPASVQQVEGGITFDVWVSGARVGYGGTGFCGLDWELAEAVVTASVTTEPGAASVVLTDSIGYALTASLPG